MCTSVCMHYLDVIRNPHLGRVGGVGRFARHFNESSLEICPKRYPPLRDVLVITTSCVCHEYCVCITVANINQRALRIYLEV